MFLKECLFRLNISVISVATIIEMPARINRLVLIEAIVVSVVEMMRVFIHMNMPLNIPWYIF